MNISKLSDYTSQFFYSLDSGLSWVMVSPLLGLSPVLWLQDQPQLQLRPAPDLQGPLEVNLGTCGQHRLGWFNVRQCIKKNIFFITFKVAYLSEVENFTFLYCLICFTHKSIFHIKSDKELILQIYFWKFKSVRNFFNLVFPPSTSHY